MPPINLIGVGAIKDLPTQLLPYKLKKTLIVTDKNMISLGYIEQLEVILKSLLISYDIFDGILHPNPTVSFVEDGLSYFPNSINVFKRDYDFIISFGGGTNHDCAKGIAIVATNGGSITDYEGYNKMTKPCLPLICINTTAGSGAELTMFTIITDESRNVKMTLADPKMTPIMSVNDPIFMNSAPKEVTASSGIDVISHAIESYVSTESSPITEALSIDALRITFTYLRRAYENGNDLEAREKMMFAEYMAGMAFNNAGLGYVHSMAHELGGFYNQTHGAYNAVVLPYVFEFNSTAIPENKIFKILDAIGEKASNKSEAVDKIVNSIITLRSDLKLPSHLKEMGLNEKDIEELSRNALKDLTAITNPRQGNFDDLCSLFYKAM